MKFYNKEISAKFIFIVAFVIGLATFQSNMFRAVDNGFFSGLDRFSQILVTGRVIAHDAGVDSQGWNLGSVKINGILEYTEDNLDTYNRLHEQGQVDSVVYFPYLSQYGIQGAFFLAVHKVLGIDSPRGLQFVNAALFSLVVALLSLLFIRVYDKKFALVFFLVMITSPWVVSFARNLYWVPFLWFLPTIFSSMLYLNKDATVRIKAILGLGVVAAVFLKSLAGYEYLSAITIFACAPFLVGPFFRAENRNHAYNMKMAVLVGALCVVGFLCALIIHAGMRGDSIASGIANIIEQDVKKRTYGDPASFDPILRESLTASVVDVLDIYWWKWATPLFAGIPAIFLSIGTVFVGLAAGYSLLRKRVADVRVFVLFAVTLLCPLSWFVLAKGHSFVHVQLNYVLWYFGFVQALAYAVVALAPPMIVDIYRFVMRCGWIAKGMVLVVPCILVLLAWIPYVKQQDAERAQHLASAVDSYDVAAGVKVMLFQNNEMSVFKKHCDASDFVNMFFVHVFPDSPEGKTGVVDGFLNLDFKMNSSNQNGLLFSEFYGSCEAVIKLPNYGVTKINIGQYSLPDVNVIWQDSVNLTRRGLVDSVTPFNLTDGNWTKGISTFAAGFFVENTLQNRQTLRLGGELLFKSSGMKKITRIDYSDQYINVFLDGGFLNPKLDGYPSKVTILDN